MSREQAYLRAILKKPLHRVKYVDDVLTVGSNHAGSNEGTAMQIEITNFGQTDLKLRRISAMMGRTTERFCFRE